MREYDDLDYSFEEAEDLHGAARICIKCGMNISFDADIQRWWVVYQYGNPPPFTYDCPKGFRHDGGV